MRFKKIFSSFSLWKPFKRRGRSTWLSRVKRSHAARPLGLKLKPLLSTWKSAQADSESASSRLPCIERGIDPAAQWGSQSARVKTLPKFMEAPAGLKVNESASGDFHELSEGFIPTRIGRLWSARVKTLPQLMEALAGLKKANESASNRLF